MEPKIPQCIVSFSDPAKEAWRRGHFALQSSNQKLFRKGLSRNFRAMPNILANSDFLFLTARLDGPDYSRELMSPRINTSATYFGPAIDEYLNAGWLQLIFEAQNSLGQQVTINRASFLRSIGRTSSGRDYDWLQKAMLVFLRARFVIRIGDQNGTVKFVIGEDRPLHLLSNFVFDSLNESYTFMIDPRWKLVFGDCDYTLIDWNKWLEIGPGHVVAKALQRVIASSSNIHQRLDLEKLKRKLNYQSPKCKFKKSLALAISELERTQIISNGKLGFLKNGKECLFITRDKAKFSVDKPRV